MMRDPEPNPALTEAWAVRASVTSERMPYARTRRIDVAHPFRGVATRGVDLTDIVQRAHALGLLLDGRGAISHTSAALVRGFPVPRSAREHPALHVSVPRPQRAPRLRGVHGHSLDLDDGEIERMLVVSPSTREPLPVPIVSEPLILLSCATQLPLPDLVALADAMLQRAAVERRADPVLAALELGPHRPGLAALRPAARMRRAGVRSRAETLLRLMVADAGLPEPEVAHPVHSTALSMEDWVAETDLAWPRYRVLLEYEGDVHRVSRSTFVRDVRRFERYVDEGWRPLRATRDDVFRDPRELLGRLTRRLVEGGWSPPRGWRLRDVAPAVP